MWFIPIALITLVALAVGLWFISNWRYYGRMFSEEHFREFHSKLARGIEVAATKPSDTPPKPDDGSAFLTQRGLAVGISSRTGEDGKIELHVSLSQSGRPTTNSVASRFGFFVLVAINPRKGEFNPFFSESRVHHLVFILPGDTVTVRDFESSYADYIRDFKPIPFKYQALQG